MPWRSCFLPHTPPRHVGVVGLDIGPDRCCWVVLLGDPHQTDRVCCAENLPLPEGWVRQGELLQPEAMGQWLRTRLDAAGHQANTVCIGIDQACVSTYRMTLAANLSPDDVAFQLQAEVASKQPQATNSCMDYSLDTEPAPTGEQGYVVQIASRLCVEALQRMARAAGWRAVVVEPRHDAARRAQVHDTTSITWPPADAALRSPYDAALGLALRAWGGEGVNFLPHREEAQHLLRRTCFCEVARYALGGAVGAACLAWGMSWMAHAQTPLLADVEATAHAYAQAQKQYAQANALQQRHTAQTQWLTARQALQGQALQWSRVLSHATPGVWVARVTQQGLHWSVQGEALSEAHVQQLVQQLQALGIWTQAPELPQLQRLSVTSRAGLPVWEFRMDADLRQGP